MKHPAADRAVVDASKVRDYLLSPVHPVGRFKAAFFEALGYSQGEWGLLVADLARLAAERDCTAGEATAFGQKYELRGTLTGPSGRSARVVTVWIVVTGEAVPRFVTAFPGSKP